MLFRSLTFQEMLDIVTAVQVNHYFREDERMAAIKKCYTALKENGIYISFEKRKKRRIYTSNVMDRIIFQYRFQSLSDF